MNFEKLSNNTTSCDSTGRSRSTGTGGNHSNIRGKPSWCVLWPFYHDATASVDSFNVNAHNHSQGFLLKFRWSSIGAFAWISSCQPSAQQTLSTRLSVQSAATDKIDALAIWRDNSRRNKGDPVRTGSAMVQRVFQVVGHLYAIDWRRHRHQSDRRTETAKITVHWSTMSDRLREIWARKRRCDSVETKQSTLFATHRMWAVGAARSSAAYRLKKFTLTVRTINLIFLCSNKEVGFLLAYRKMNT